jgi:hypothetical protein
LPRSHGQNAVSSSARAPCPASNKNQGEDAASTLPS